MATYRVTEDCIVAGKVAGSLLTDDDLAGLHIDQLLESRAIYVDGETPSAVAPVQTDPEPAADPVAEAVL